MQPQPVTSRSRPSSQLANLSNPWLTPLPTTELQQEIRRLAALAPTICPLELPSPTNPSPSYPVLLTEICGLWVHDPDAPGHVACLQIRNTALDHPVLDPSHMFLLTGAQINATLRAFLGDLQRRANAEAYIDALVDACRPDRNGSGDRGVGGIGFGVWHTHPGGSVGPSRRDLAVARQLEHDFGRRIPQLVISGPFGDTDGGRFALGPAVQF